MPSKELYQLAKSFHSTRLWEKLYDTDLFAVLAEDGSIGYCSVMGNIGEHFALAVYPGAEGLNSLYALLEQPDIYAEEIAQTEHLMSQNCVMCSFEDKSELHAADIKQIKAHNLSFRGKHAYPMFRQYSPRRYPWFFRGAEDEKWMRLGLAAAMEVSVRLGDSVTQINFLEMDAPQTKQVLGFTNDALLAEIPLLEEKSDGAFAWSMIALPKASNPIHEKPSLPNEMTLAKLKKKRQGGIWECELFMCPEPIAIDDPDNDDAVQAPFFPLMLLVTDHRNGSVLQLNLASCPSDEIQFLFDGFIDLITKKSVPAELLVRNQRTFSMFSDLAQRLGIRLFERDELDLLEEAQKDILNSFWQHMETEIDPDNELDMLNEMIANLLQADISDMPADIRAQLKELSQSDALDPSLRKKLSLKLDEPKKM